MTRVILTPAARFELLDAQDWYESQREGLGTRFRGQVEATVERMIDNPYQFPVVFQDVHHARLRKFPYALLFRIETDVLIVIACFHGSRDPQIWRRRI